MRIQRVTFAAGLAMGYVLGAQAGRERYEQLKQLARKAAESPAMQQTAGALHAQATATAKTARDKAASSVRKGASKVGRRNSSSGRASTATLSGNGSAPGTTDSGDDRPFVPIDGSFREGKLT